MAHASTCIPRGTFPSPWRTCRIWLYFYPNLHFTISCVFPCFMYPRCSNTIFSEWTCRNVSITWLKYVYFSVPLQPANHFKCALHSAWLHTLLIAICVEDWQLLLSRGHIQADITGQILISFVLACKGITARLLFIPRMWRASCQFVVHVARMWFDSCNVDKACSLLRSCWFIDKCFVWWTSKVF